MYITNIYNKNTEVKDTSNSREIHLLQRNQGALNSKKKHLTQTDPSDYQNREYLALAPFSRKHTSKYM